MAITPKRLVQSIISEGTTEKYTTPASTLSQISEIWIVNDSNSAVEISLYAAGLDPVNMFIKELKIRPGASARITDCKIIMNAGEKLGTKLNYYLSSRNGEVSITVYGIEEGL